MTNLRGDVDPYKPYVRNGSSQITNLGFLQDKNIITYKGEEVLDSIEGTSVRVSCN